jgi:trehalose 6-phosphate phosphatase
VKPLSSPEGQDELRRLAGASTLYAFDFDGTLAPIVSQPDRARSGSGVRRRLALLARQAPVVVISGRSLADLRPRIPAEVRLCVGNHGSEGIDGGIDGGVDAELMRQVCDGWARRLEEMLAEPPRVAGIVVENKGLTLSVHYRLARDRTSAARRLAEFVKQLVPAPRVIGGKYVVNLLPPGARTKFETLVEIARRESAERVLFVGDDETDELVFEQAPPHWMTVRVELDHSSRAKYFVHQQAEVAMLLDRLLELMRGRSAPARGKA